MLKVINWALTHCGSSLEKVLKSKRFAVLLDKESKVSTVDQSSNEGIALKAGHLGFGKLINCLPEKEAVEQAKALGGVEKYSHEERALIRICGEMIVRAASKCLPENVLLMAKRWKAATSDEQILIARELFYEFRSEGQNARGEMSMKRLQEKMIEGQKRREKEEWGYLPGLYKAWNRENCPANCQGKTQMLVAFAKLAGAKVIVVHPIEHANEYVTRKRREVKQAVIDDLMARGLEDGSQEFADGMSAGYYDDLMKDKDGECFHVGVALELRDGRWVMVDPHGLSWGLIPESWNLSQARQVLKKYQAVLPGLTVVAGNSKAGRAVVDGMVARAYDVLERSRKMGENIKSNVRSIPDLVSVVRESDDFELLFRLNSELTGEPEIDFSIPERRELAVMLTVMGGMEAAFDFTAMLDPSFLEKRIKSWLTFYHACVMNIFLNREGDDGKLIHPICEVSADVEWAIAISAINSACFDCHYGRDEEEENFFIRNSFDQTSLYNAMRFRNEPIGVAAHKTLKSLAFIHPMCVRRIKSMERSSYGW